MAPLDVNLERLIFAGLIKETKGNFSQMTWSFSFHPNAYSMSISYLNDNDRCNP